ncbi:MAG TPA: hypothetical protein VNY33_10070, partial [Gaiellaceae bacterium]|nr:hypothetical protein [Gaiellaceae bacterium]
AYILTRPLGASLGDYMSQARKIGGLGLGTTTTSVIFLGAILVVVAFLSVTRRDSIETVTSHAKTPSRVLVVAHGSIATPALLKAIRERAARGPVGFHLLVPNPAPAAELTEAERSRRHAEGEHALARALPLIDQAAGNPTEGSVSVRHDPLDAVEETLRTGDFHEIMLSLLPHGVSLHLHLDLRHRLAHLGLPIITVIGDEQGAASLA